MEDIAALRAKRRRDRWVSRAETYERVRYWSVYISPTNYLNTSWDGDSKAAGTYTIDTSAWGIPEGVRACYIRITARYNGTVSDSYWVAATHPDNTTQYNVLTRINVGSAYNDREGWVACDDNGDFNIVVNGTTMDEVWLVILGWAL